MYSLELASAQLAWETVDPITPAVLYSIELLVLDGRRLGNDR